MKTVRLMIVAAILSGITLLQGTTLSAIEGVDEYVAYQHRSPDFGSLTVHGPMKVEGDLLVAGDLTVHGPMNATRIEYAQFQAPQTAVRVRQPPSMGRLRLPARFWLLAISSLMGH